MGGVGTFGVVVCVQEVTGTPGELLADAGLIHYTMGASGEKAEMLKPETGQMPDCNAGRLRVA